jgi:hypothetical protein
MPALAYFPFLSLFSSSHESCRFLLLTFTPFWLEGFPETHTPRDGQATRSEGITSDRRDFPQAPLREERLSSARSDARGAHVLLADRSPTGGR